MFRQTWPSLQETSAEEALLMFADVGPIGIHLGMAMAELGSGLKSSL